MLWFTLVTSSRWTNIVLNTSHGQSVYACTVPNLIRWLHSSYIKPNEKLKKKNYEKKIKINRCKTRVRFEQFEWMKNREFFIDRKRQYFSQMVHCGFMWMKWMKIGRFVSSETMDWLIPEYTTRMKQKKLWKVFERFECGLTSTLCIHLKEIIKKKSQKRFFMFDFSLLLFFFSFKSNEYQNGFQRININVCIGASRTCFVFCIFNVRSAVLSLCSKC